MNRFGLALAAALAASAHAAAVRAAPLVLRSAGPSAKVYTPGKTLPEKAPVSLKPGDVVTVLVAAGTRVLRGPGSFTLGGGGGMAAFNPRARFGAMRSGEIESPSLWEVDVTQSGTVCLADPARIVLWRPDAAETARLTLKPASGGASATIDWPAGKATLPWPGKTRLAAGAEYAMTLSGSGDTSRIRFVTLPSVPEDLGMLAQSLIDRGCQGQLDLLIDTTPEAPD
jgi:hypothetical protein